MGGGEEEGEPHQMPKGRLEGTIRKTDKKQARPPMQSG